MTTTLTVSDSTLERLAFETGAEITHITTRPQLTHNGVTYVAGGAR